MVFLNFPAVCLEFNLLLRILATGMVFVNGSTRLLARCRVEILIKMSSEVTSSVLQGLRCENQGKLLLSALDRMA